MKELSLYFVVCSSEKESFKWLSDQLKSRSKDSFRSRKVFYFWILWTSSFGFHFRLNRTFLEDVSWIHTLLTHFILMIKLQWITKKPCVFPVYLQNRLSYKKSISIYLYKFLKSSQLKKEFFKSDDKISWYWRKR